MLDDGGTVSIKYQRLDIYMLAIPGNYILLINDGLVFVPFCIVQFGNKLIFQTTVVFGGNVQSEPFLEDLQLVVRLIGEVG